MNSTSIPVLYFHRIGSPDGPHLSIPKEIFEKQMEFLNRNGFQTISLQGYLNFLNGKSEGRKKQVMITFDDGYRDNLVNAHEILKKFHFKGIIFGCSGLVRPELQKPCAKEVTLTEALTRARRGDFSSFLSENEIKKMFESGVWEFHSHSHSHSEVFCGTKIESIYPELDKHWGIVSAYRDPLSEGSWPVFRKYSGLVKKGFFPKISEFKKSLPVSSFSKMKDWVGKELDKKKFFIEENDEDFRSRVRNELEVSKNFFSRYHSGEANGICWPWGKYSPDLIEMTKEVGYQAAFTTQSGPNFPGHSPFEVKRFNVKKLSLFRFALGIWLRRNSILARIYGVLRGKI